MLGGLGVFIPIPLPNQSYISKGIWRQGIGSFVRISIVSTLCPVVLCPYMCTSDRTQLLQTSHSAHLFHTYVLQTVLGMGMGMNVAAQIRQNTYTEHVQSSSEQDRSTMHPRRRVCVPQDFSNSSCDLVRHSGVHTEVHILRWPDHRENPSIRESRILAPVRPRMQAAGLQCLKLQISLASPEPRPRAFPGTKLSRKIRSPHIVVAPSRHVVYERWCIYCLLERPDNKHIHKRIIYVCVYIYIDICMYIYMYIYIYIHVHVHIHVDIHMYTYIGAPRILSMAFSSRESRMMQRMFKQGAARHTRSATSK